MATGSIVANTGRKIALNRLWNSSPTYTVPSVFKVGIGTTTPAITQTDLVNAVPINSTEAVDACDATTGWTDSADMTVSLNNSVYVEGTGSLNLTKDGTGSADASTSKTTTSIADFSSKQLCMFLYIADSTVYAQLATTDCLTIRFGTDSSNYRQWTRDKADLAVGWNFIQNMTTSNADSTTGSPGTSNHDYTFVQLTATASGQTWASGKIIMDDLKVASSGDYVKTFVSGYPLTDETNLQSTVRTLVTTNEANGQTLTEWGLFNTDSSRLMFSRQVFTAISKTSSIQLIFVEKDKIT